MDSEPEESLKERAQNLQKLVRGPLASSIQNLSDSSRNIPPGTDFHFFNNFPAFREPIKIIKNRSESLLREIGASQSLWKRPSHFPVDSDEAYDWLVSIQDDIFERVDVSMDEFKRVRNEQHSGKPGSFDDIESGFQLVYGSRKKGRDRKLALDAKATAVEGDISGGVKVLSRDKKTAGGRCRVPFHIPSITRPQDRYNIFVDNSNVPFNHLGLQKTEDGSKYIHPLQGELDKIEFAYKQSELPELEPLQPAPWESTPFKFVESVQDLKEVAIKLESESEIAVDLEHNQYRSFQGLTCLMQISTRAEDFVVDTLILHKYIGPCLRHIFANPAIKKVMHGADRDILWLQRDFGIYICNLFDTGQASRVLQLERNSLEFLLQHFCDITADKEYQTADWRLRPLPSEMLKYAREDTHYLLYIHDVMQQSLASMPSEGGEAPLFEVYKRSRDICLQLYEKELLTETSFLHVYGLLDGNLSQEQLSVAAGLYEWRDKIARVEDESTGYILPNKVLLQIAKRIPRTTNDLRSFVKGRHPFVERNLAAVLDVIKQAREMRNKAVEISPNLLKQVFRKGADGLREISLTDKQALLASADIVDAVNAKNVSAVDDAKVKFLCENSSQLEVTEGAISYRIKALGAGEVPNEGVNSISVKSDNRETIASEQTGSIIEKKQAELIESSSSAADPLVVGTTPFKKSGLASTVVGRASNSLLFNKKYDSVKGNQAILSETKGNLVCRSLEEKSQHSLSMEGCSSERPAVVNLSKEMEASIEENNSPLVTPADLSNSGKLVENATSTSDRKFLQPNFTASEEAPVIRNKVTAEGGVALVQAQKRPARGLAAMLGPSKLKQKNEMSSKVYDTEQDNVRNKVEQIKASVALPFQSFSGSREVDSIQHLNSREVHTNEESQLEVGKVVGTEVTCSNVDIENNLQALKISAGIFSEEGKKYRAWWPPLQDKVDGNKSSIREIDNEELPPSLSELRRRSWQQGKRQSSFGFQQNTRSEAPSHANEYLDGKKRKKHSSVPRDSNKFFATSHGTEGSFKPFDYAAARKTMNFGMNEERPRDVKGRSGSKNLFGKKGKGSGYDPMNSGASEGSLDGGIQAGKRRQVFPASGNRSATFR